MPPKKRPTADWSWVGTTVRNPEEITSHHRWLAAGLEPTADLISCPREYSLDLNPNSESDPQQAQPQSRTRSRSSTATSSDIVETDKDGKIKPTKLKFKFKTPGCTAKGCKGNPWCYNHLGADKVMDPEGKQNYIKEHAEEIARIRDGPAGLRNLGATCYANAFLQLWFHNVSFRNGVYDCVLSESTPLYHLASVFAMLQYSERAVVDPSFLIEALRLDKGDQQDAGEFSKLFMNVLENEFKKHPDPDLRTFMKHQFEGTMQYVTKCECGYESKTETTFLELEISLRDKASLQQCLDASFAPETLEGNNQYHCPACLRPRDATRRQQPIVYPPVVHISLMRFMYDYNTMTRKKVKASIRYPNEIRLGEDRYELRGVIIHHGTTAHRGHFTCKVWDEVEKHWLLCNDEEVTRIEDEERPKKRLKLDLEAEPGTQSSRDAYMLVYKRKNTDVLPIDPPVMVGDRVWADNIALENEGLDAAVKREAIEDEYVHLNGAKKDVLNSIEGADHIVPRDALSKWFNADTFDELCEPFDMTPILCDHGGVDPDKTAERRLTSEEAFDKISILNNLSSLEICPICVEEGFKLRIADNELRSRIVTFDSLNEDGGRWIIPAIWLDRWKNGDLSPDTLPTHEEYTLYCEHDGRAIEAAGHRDRRNTTTITDEALMLLRSIFGDFPAFQKDHPTCQICSEADKMDEGARETRRADVSAHKKIRKDILRSATVYDLDHYGIPSGFVEELEEYIAGKHSERPQLRLLCDHGGLDYDPEKDRVYLLTERGWNILQELYGEQEPVVLRFGPDYVSGRQRQVVNDCKMTCEDCRRARLLDWKVVSIPIRVYQDNSNNGNKPVVADASTDKPSFPLMNGFNRFTNANANANATSRTSARSTRSSGTYMEFKVDNISKSTSIRDLKVEIMRRKKLSPISQRLIHNGRELDKSDETMESIGYLAGDEIRLEEIEEGDEDDIMDMDIRMDGDIGDFGGAKKVNGRVEGFGGTALLSRIACPQCTYENAGYAKSCEMCYAEFERLIADLAESILQLFRADRHRYEQEYYMVMVLVHDI
ncbi:hypothetical protein IAT40_005931 [Kwoniella sp. CBS 6097]